MGGPCKCGPMSNTGSVSGHCGCAVLAKNIQEEQVDDLFPCIACPLNSPY